MDDSLLPLLKRVLGALLEAGLIVIDEDSTIRAVDVELDFDPVGFPSLPAEIQRRFGFVDFIL